MKRIVEFDDFKIDEPAKNPFMRHLNARTFIFSFLLGAIFTQGQELQAENRHERYNILWLSCEDIGPVISAYGAEGISTPNIDRLAKEGITFTHAYSTTGVCAPSRSAIITGMHPVSIGSHNMRTGPHVNFRSPNKETYKTYKKIVDVDGKNIPEYSVVPPMFVKCFPEYLRQAGYYCTNNVKCDYQFACPITAWDEVDVNAHYRNRKKDQPFFAVFNHEVTHERFIWQKENDPMLADTSKVRVPAYYPDISVVRKDIGRKYSNIVELDNQIGEWLAKLENEDLLEKTIIFFWSDHGGPLLNQKRAVGNSGLHVPLIVRFPDKYMAGTRIDELVSLMDLGPTVLSLAGLNPPDYMQGKAFLGDFKEEQSRKYVFGNADRFDEHSDMSRSVIDGRFVYIRNFKPQLAKTYRLNYRENIEMTRELIHMNQEGKLHGDAAYIWRNSKPEEELYDLKTDPDEVHNLAFESRFQGKLNELREALGTWQLRVGDKGFIPENELVNMMWPGMIQPETESVEFNIDGDGSLILSSKTKGASIAYQTLTEKGSMHWLLYQEPLSLKIEDKIQARAIRLGYKTSEISLFSLVKNQK